MRPSHILLFLFFAIPLTEIYLLISVGQAIGAISTIFIVVFTAIIGTILLRVQGLSTLRRVQLTLERGEVPAIEIMEGLLLLIGGALLLIPGFFTDAIGFICLITPAREAVIRYWIKRYGTPIHNQSSSDTASKAPRTLEGEYWKEDDQ